MFSRSQGSSWLSPRATAEYCGRWVWQSIRPGKIATVPRSIQRTGAGALPFAQIVVIADLRDAAVFHDNGAIALAAERAVFGGVDQEPADSKRAGVRLHKGETPTKNSRNRWPRAGQVCQKKGFGQRTRRNNKYEKRAAARIALTCLI